MRIGLIEVAALILFLSIILFANKYANETLREKCEESGGTFLFSPSSSKSLCELPKKN
jgi:hypothetical protein